MHDRARAGAVRVQSSGIPEGPITQVLVEGEVLAGEVAGHGIEITVAVHVTDIHGKGVAAHVVRYRIGEIAPPVAQQDRHVVLVPIGREHVHMAVAVDVSGDDHPGAAAAGELAVVVEAALAIAEIDDHLSAAIGPDEQIGNPVAVGVRRCASLAGSGVRGECHRVVKAAGAVVSHQGHRAVPRGAPHVRRGNVGESIAVGVQETHAAHRSARPVVPAMTKRAAALTHEHAHEIVAGVAHREIDQPVPVEVRAFVGTGDCSSRNGEHGKILVPAPSVIQEHPHVVRLFVGNGKIGIPVAVEVTRVSAIALHVTLPRSADRDGFHPRHVERARAGPNPEAPRVSCIERYAVRPGDASGQRDGDRLACGEGVIGDKPGRPVTVFDAPGAGSHRRPATEHLDGLRTE